MRTTRLTVFGRLMVFLLLVAVVLGGGYFLGLFDDIIGKGKVKVDGQSTLAPAPPGVLSLACDEWVGYAPILMANGGLTTAPGSIFDRLGLKVQLNVLGDTQSADALASGSIAGLACTVNRYALTYTKFADAGVPVKMVYLIDQSAGGDGLVASEGINRIEDLAGKRVGVTKYSVSQALLEWLLAKSSLTDSQVNGIRRNMVFFDDPGAAAKACFEGKVDAAATWQPYLTEATRMAGMHQLFSTKSATNLIMDGLVVREDYLKDHPDQISKFIEGCLKAIETYGKTESARYLRDGFSQFASLSDDDIVAQMADASPVNFGLNQELGSGTVQALFRDMSLVWQSLDEKAQPDKADAAFDFSHLKALAPKFTGQVARTTRFTDAQRSAAMAQSNNKALMTQRLTIKFASGAASIDSSSFGPLNEFAQVAKIMNNVVIQIEGNTDNVGDRAFNRDLSLRRAQAVATYLKYQGLDPTRFVVVGNGPDKPVGSNAIESGKASNRRTDVYFKVVN